MTQLDAPPLDFRLPPQPTHLAYWGMLLLVLSPVLASLVRHLCSNRFDHYIAVPALLFVLLLRHPPGPRPSPHRGGLLLLALGLGLVMLGLASESATIARIGAVSSVAGMGTYLGNFGLRTGLVLALAIPIPAFVTNWTTPWTENAYISVLEPILRGIGVHTKAFGSVLEIDGRRLELFPEDSGLRLAVVGAALGLLRGLRHSSETRAMGLLTLLSRQVGPSAIAAAACQFPGVILAAAWTFFVSEALGAFWLGTGIWVSVAMLGYAIITKARTSSAESD